MKLTPKQKEVITLLREGHFLYENKITPGARFCITPTEGGYRWGNVNGNVIMKIMPLLTESTPHTGVREHKLNELGKTIEL